jgi:nucleoside 2-deoxyribosyltransferase
MLIDSLYKFRKDHPESLRVAFFMTKFSNKKPYIDIFTILKQIYLDNGITLLRADDKIYHPDLYTNIETYMHSCGSGIAFFDTMEKEDFNPNVAFEAGYMMSLKKPVCLLKNELNKNLQSDLMGKIYITLNPFDIEESIKDDVTKWLKDNELCFTCSECYITLKENLINSNAQAEKFKKIETGIKSILRNNHVLKYKGISNNDDDNTIFRYDCNSDFYNCVVDFFKTGVLNTILDTTVLNVSTTPDLGYKNYDYVWKIEDFVPQEGQREKIVHVCKLSAIDGWHIEKSIAEGHFTTKQTDSLNNCEVFITCRDGLIYFHSNFIIRGFNYPTKMMAHQGSYNLIEVLKILTTNQYPDPHHIDERLVLAHCSKIKYYIDRSMIDREGKFKIDLDGARSIKIVP